MKKSKNTEKGITEFAVIDVETTLIEDGKIPETLFWGFADKNGYKSFKTTNQMLKFLKSYPSRTLLHHSNFDVIQLLLDGATVKPLRSHNNKLIRCKMGKHDLLNSFAVFPMALGKIFQCFGYEKTDLGQLEKRNYEDCVNGLDCFLRLDEIISKLCQVSPLHRGTIAGTSFSAAQLEAGEKMPVDLDYLEAFRGGRVEVFDTRKTMADKFDINSSYPYSILETPEKDNLLRLRVTTHDYYCPFFHVDTGDCLLFPNGTFETYIYQSNLEKYILPNCEKTKIKVLSKTKIDFGWLCSLKPLVKRLYQTKQDAKAAGQKALEEAAKLLLNSMYGRMGLKGDSERVRLMTYHPMIEDGTVYELGKEKFLVFDTVFRDVKSNYPYAAWITCNARARLYRAFVGARAWYGDTDSVMTPHGTSYFEQHEKLGIDCGEWKHEGNDSFKANNVKDYFWGEDEIRKGGAGFIEWTMKRMASGQPPRKITRERVSEIRKRNVLQSGETLPLNITG